MTATDRSARQSTADHAGREARIEAVTRDLVADVEWEQKRQAIVLEFEDGRVEYSPEVEVTAESDGTVTINPITPFRKTGGSDDRRLGKTDT